MVPGGNLFARDPGGVIRYQVTAGKPQRRDNRFGQFVIAVGERRDGLDDDVDVRLDELPVPPHLRPLASPAPS